MIFTAYLTVAAAAYLTDLPDLRANGADVTDHGHGIVSFGEDVMSILDGFADTDDGCVTQEGATIHIFIGGDAYPVVHDDGDPTAVLAQTIAVLPQMPPLARVVVARRLVNTAKATLSAVADAATVDLTVIHRDRGGYTAVATALGVGRGAVNKAVVRHRRDPATAQIV